MIPCRICGKDASTNWVTGLPPAPDSQKMALCAEHDTPENRKELLVAWHLSMIKAIRAASNNAAYFAARGSLRMLTLYFSAGGSLNMPCINCEVTDHGTLNVTAPDGTQSFFPMQHVRRYDLALMAPDMLKKSTK